MVLFTTIQTGIYLLCVQNNVHLLQVETRHRPQLQSQQWFNFMLLIYVVMTMIVTARYSESTFWIYIYVVCTAGDVLFRILCLISLESLMGIEPRNEEEREAGEREARNEEGREAGNEEGREAGNEEEREARNEEEREAGNEEREARNEEERRAGNEKEREAGNEEKTIEAGNKEKGEADDEVGIKARNKEKEDPFLNSEEDVMYDAEKEKLVVW